MGKHLKTIAVALGIALASTGSAFADGERGAGGGDNSISPWRGESYAHFHRDNTSKPGANGAVRVERSAAEKPLQGDFYTSPAEVAGAGEFRSRKALAVASGFDWCVGRAFRDDAAA